MILRCRCDPGMSATSTCVRLWTTCKYFEKIQYYNRFNLLKLFNYAVNHGWFEGPSSPCSKDAAAVIAPIYYKNSINKTSLRSRMPHKSADHRSKNDLCIDRGTYGGGTLVFRIHDFFGSLFLS